MPISDKLIDQLDDHKTPKDILNESQLPKEIISGRDAALVLNIGGCLWMR